MFFAAYFPSVILNNRRSTQRPWRWVALARGSELTLPERNRRPAGPPGREQLVGPLRAQRGEQGVETGLKTGTSAARTPQRPTPGLDRLRQLGRRGGQEVGVAAIDRGD